MQRCNIFVTYLCVKIFCIFQFFFVKHFGVLPITFISLLPKNLKNNPFNFR